jgi:hypothetical protein
VEAEEQQNEQERAAGATTAASLYNELEAGDIDAQRLLAFVSSYRKQQGAELDSLLSRRSLKSASSEHLRFDDRVQSGHQLSQQQQQQQQLEAEDEEEARLFDELEQAVRKTAALHGLSSDAVSPQRDDASKRQQQRFSTEAQQPTAGVTAAAGTAAQGSPGRHRHTDLQQQQQPTRGASPVVHRPYSNWRGTDVDADVDTDDALQFGAALDSSRQNGGALRQSAAAGTTTVRQAKGLHVQTGSTPSYALPTKHFKQRRDGDDAAVVNGTGTGQYAAAHERDYQVRCCTIQTFGACKLV